MVKKLDAIKISEIAESGNTASYPAVLILKVEDMKSRWNRGRKATIKIYSALSTHLKLSYSSQLT